MISLPLLLAVESRDPAQVKDAAKRILSGSEFTNESSWAARIRDWLKDPFSALGDLWTYLKSLLGGGEGVLAAWLAWGFTILLAALVVGLVVKFASGSSVSDVVHVRRSVASGRTRADMLAEAEEHESSGDFRRAIRSRHAALVLTLVERKLVRRQAGKTAREYEIELRAAAPKASTQFDAATTLFEWAWYGTRQPTAQDVAEFRRLSDEVEKLAAK